MTATPTPERPTPTPDTDAKYRRAMTVHDEALTAYFLVVPSRHRAEAIADAGRRLLDLAEAHAGHPAVVTLTGEPTEASTIPPEHWPRCQRVSAVRLEPGQLLLGFLDTTTIHAFTGPERIEYVLGHHAAVTVHTTTGRTLVLDPYTATFRVFSDDSPADADLIACARSIMIFHLDPAVTSRCAHLGDQEVIDHATAKKIAHAYQWGWATCWFAGEGEIGHAILSGRWQTDPAAAMTHALFGWWQHSDTNPDGARLLPMEQAVIDAMGRYLTTRAAADDIGPVPGWSRMPIR